MAVPTLFAPKVTEVGAAAAIDASNIGLTLRLTHMSFGTGQYDPDGTETALFNEVKRVPMTGAMRPRPNQLRVAGVWNEELDESEIGEIGYWADDILFAVWSRATGGPIGFKTIGVAFVLFCELVFEDLPADSVEILINTDVSEGISSLLVHEVADDAHAQYLLRRQYIDAHALNTAVTVAGTDNAITMELPPEVDFDAYVFGQKVVFVAATSNTGPVTINVNSKGAKPVRKSGSLALAAGDIIASCVYTLFYDGVAWQISGGVGGSASMMPYSFTATSGQTVFSFPYTPGSLLMFQNGELLGDSAYTATDGANVTLAVGATLSDQVVGVALKTFAIADAYTKPVSDARYTPRTLEAQLQPPGMVSYFAGTSAPAGWLVAGGTTVSRTTYAALFAVIGITYGAGDGSTTFRLPDLRGEFIRGVDGGRGVDVGRVLGSSQADDLKAHTHNAPTSTGVAGAFEVAGGAFNVDYSPAVPTSSTGGSETRPRNIALLPCIKT